MKYDEEAGRLAFLENRDGRKHALGFARRTYALYRRTLRYGFGMTGRPVDPNNRRGAHGLPMRRSFVLSCLSFREYLRSPP